MSTKLNRRSFLQATAALAAMPLISGCVSKVNAMEKMASLKPGSKFITNGTINTAAHWGPLNVTVEQGKIVKSGNYFKKHMVNNLQTTVEDLVYAPDRIKYPMVRKSYLKDPDNNKPELRGRDEWVRVSWDEAIKLAADQMKKTRKSKGANGIFAGSYGWKSAGALHNSQILLHRFQKLCGGFVGHKGDYSTGASQVIMPHVTGSLEVYEQQTSWEVILKDSDIVVLWGANPMMTLKNSYSSSDNQGFEYFKRLRDSGKKVIIIDPIYSATCDFMQPADHITPKPNTDTAMMIAMCYELFAAKKHDQAFLDDYAEGFDKFKDYFLGKEDGVKKDAKWASEICGVPASKIKELALLFAANRTMLMSGWSMQRQHHGEQPHWALATLASMLGQIGLPGGGFGLSYHYDSAGTPSSKAAVIAGISAKSKYEDKSGDKDVPEHLQQNASVSIPVARIVDMLQNPGKTIDYNGTKITYPEVETVYWAGGNPFHQHQDTNTQIEAWKNVKNFIINEMYWTASSRMADIVFPVTTPYERNDLTMGGGYSNKYLYPMKAVVPAENEAKSDFEIFTLLSEQFGVQKAFTENKTEMDWLSEIYENARKIGKTKGLNMPGFRKFWTDNKPITFPVTEEAKQWVRHADFREDPLLSPLGTPSGKIEIYSETIAAMGYDDCKGHPTWMEPVEWLGMKNKPAPLALISTHPDDRLHSQQNNTSLRHTYEVQGREPIWINTKDAKARDIKDGDVVRVFNKRGQTLAGAVVTDKIIEGVVRLSEGSWYDPMEPGVAGSLCKHGNVNTLTVDIPTSKLANGNSAHTALCDVEKYTGKLPEISLFKQPKMA